MDTILFATILIAVVTNTAMLCVTLHAVTHCNITVTTVVPAPPAPVYTAVSDTNTEQSDKDMPVTLDDVLATVNKEMFGGIEDAD